MYMQTKQENVQVCNSYDTIVVIDDLLKSNMCARQQECGRCPRRTSQPRFLQPPEVIGGTKVDAYARNDMIGWWRSVASQALPKCQQSEK